MSHSSSLQYPDYLCCFRSLTLCCTSIVLINVLCSTVDCISVFQNHLPVEGDIKDADLQDDGHGLLDIVYQQPFEETTQTKYEGFTEIELKEKGCNCRRQCDFKSFITELGTDVTVDNLPCMGGL